MCTYIRTHLLPYTHTHTHAHTLTHTHTHTHTHAHTHTHTQVYSMTLMRDDAGLQEDYVDLCVKVRIYMYTYKP